jgi:hypothetical protein
MKNLNEHREVGHNFDEEMLAKRFQLKTFIYYRAV